MHALKIHKDIEGAIVIEASEFSSISLIATEKQQEPAILVPTFPSNWPQLLDPAAIDEKCKSETSIACNKLVDMKEAKRYYNELWKQLSDTSPAKELHEAMVLWLKEYASSSEEMVC